MGRASKRLKKKITKKTDMFKSLAGKDTAGEAKYKDKLDATSAQLSELQGETDPAKLLEKEMAEYGGLDAKTLAMSEADARRAGTFADTREFRSSLEGEAGARSRGLKAMARERINALRAKLGQPALPEGTTI